MKLLIKYMGLLIFSGLIIPFYISIIPYIMAPAKTGAKSSLQTAIPRAETYGFSFYSDIVKNIFPVLKNLN